MGQNSVGRVSIDLVVNTQGVSTGTQQASKKLNKLTDTVDKSTRATGLHRRSSRRGTQALLEFSRGAEDAAVVFGTQGFAGAIRASVNNTAQLATILNPMAGVIVGLTGAVLAFVAGRWERNLRNTSKEVDVLASRLERLDNVAGKLAIFKAGIGEGGANAIKQAIASGEASLIGLEAITKRKISRIQRDEATAVRDLLSGKNTPAVDVGEKNIFGSIADIEKEISSLQGKAKAGGLFDDPVLSADQIRRMTLLKGALKAAKAESKKFQLQITDLNTAIDDQKTALRELNDALFAKPAVAQKPPGVDVGKARDEFDKFKSSLETNIISPLAKLDEVLDKDIKTIDRLGQALNMTKQQIDDLKGKAAFKNFGDSFKILKKAVDPLKEIQKQLSATGLRGQILRGEAALLKPAADAARNFANRGVAAQQAGTAGAFATVQAQIRGTQARKDPQLEKLNTINKQIETNTAAQLELLKKKEVLVIKSLL